MSTMVLHIIELIKDLPLGDQKVIANEMGRHLATVGSLPQTELEPEEFSPEDCEGVDNNHPFFEIMEKIEAERDTQQDAPLTQAG